MNPQIIPPPSRLEDKPEPLPPYLTMKEIAGRWRVSESSVRRHLRSHAAKVVDWAMRGKKGTKIVPSSEVRRIERIRTKQIR